MRVKVPTEQEVHEALRRLRAQGNDDALCEAKSCAAQIGRSVWESVSAFANTAGGLLLLGIDERAGFAPAEGFDANRAINQFLEGMGDGTAAGVRLTNPPLYELARVQVEGKTVVAIRIAENAPGLKPCFITTKGPAAGAFRRLDDHDIQLSPSEAFEMQTALTPNTAEQGVVPEAGVNNLDQNLLARFLNKRIGTKSMDGTQTDQERLAQAGITDIDGNVLLAGLIAFGRYPQRFLPLCNVDVTVWPTTSGQLEPDVRYVDRIICEGSLSAMVDQAVAGIMRNLRTGGVVRGIRRIDVPEVPKEAIREAVANALLHREYEGAFRSMSVTVRVFRDRIEITSPGGLWGGKTLATLADGASRCRNPILMQIMRDVPYQMDVGASIEGLGHGIAYMTAAMLEAGLPAPSFKADPDRFTVRLARPAELAMGTDSDGRATIVRIPNEAHETLGEQGGNSVEGSSLSTNIGYYMPNGDCTPGLDGFAPAGFGRVWGGPEPGFHPAGYDPWEELRKQSDAVDGQDTNVAAETPKQTQEGQTQEHFFMMTKDGWVLEILRERYPEPLDIREIAQEGGKSLPTARRAVRDLIDAGHVVPTAPPTSRNRKYVLAASA